MILTSPHTMKVASSKPRASGDDPATLDALSAAWK